MRVQCNENYNSEKSKIHYFRFHHPEQPREKLDDSFKEEVKLKLSIAASNSYFFVVVPLKHLALLKKKTFIGLKLLQLLKKVPTDYEKCG